MLTATDLAKLYALARIIRKSYMQNQACTYDDMTQAVDASFVVERILRKYEIRVQEEEGFAEYIRKQEAA